MNPTLADINEQVEEVNETAGDLGITSPIKQLDTDVDAADLTNPTPTPEIPTPKVATQPSQFVENLTPAIEQGQQGLIQAQTKEAEQRGDVLSRLLSEDTESTQSVFEDTFSGEIERITGTPASQFLQSLSDANTQLATLQGKFRTQAQKVSGGEGQSKVFEFTQLNELDRQKAVEVGNQALLVQALQGNFNTARQIALDTANFTSEDRRMELDNLIAQYNALDGIVEGQEKQLIDQAKAEAEAEKAEIERTQAAVDTAILSGAATVQEMQQLTSTTIPDEQKRALAQQIVARGAGSDRALDRSIKSAQLRSELITLGLAGDAQAIEQLGYDPRNTGLTSDELTNLEQTSAQLTEDLTDIKALKENDLAINVSAGSLKGGFLGSFIETGAGSVHTNVVKQDFLNEVERFTSEYTLENLIAQKERGATFGALSNSELRILSASALKLSSLLETDPVTGEVLGISGSEEKLRSALSDLESQVLDAIDLNNSRLGLKEDELAEIRSIK